MEKVWNKNNNKIAIAALNKSESHIKSSDIRASKFYGVEKTPPAARVSLTYLIGSAAVPDFTLV